MKDICFRSLPSRLKIALRYFMKSYNVAEQNHSVRGTLRPCSNRLSANRHVEETYNIMRTVLLLTTLFLVSTAQKCNTETHQTEITFTQTKSYCGGAAPSDFLIRELRTPHPIEDRKLYLFNENLICVDSFIKPGDSTFLKDIPTGKWSIRLVDNMVMNEGKTERERCVINWKQRSLANFDIQNDTSMTLNLHFSCNPCYPPPP